MRMSPTDILDVSGATYPYLLNGQGPAANWTAPFRPGERVRLRFINGSSMSIFDVRIDGLPMKVIQADGNDVVPVTVDQFRISVAETYDVIVQPKADRAYTIFAQAEDRSGYARGTLAPRPGMTAPIPPMDPRPLRTMADMGMGGMGMGKSSVPSMDHGSMPGMDHAATSHGNMPGMKMDSGAMPSMDMGPMPGMDHGAMPGMNHGSMPATPIQHGSMAATEAGAAAQKPDRSVEVDNVAEMPTERLQSAGEGFPPGRRGLTYADLRATKPGSDPRPPTHEITLHRTASMERFIWGFDGKNFSEPPPIQLTPAAHARSF